MIRTTPWYVSDAVVFLNGFLKWKESVIQVTKCEPAVLEIGGGSSTLYFLQKGLSVVCVEADLSWRQRLLWLGKDLGFDVAESFEDLSSSVSEAVGNPFLQIVPAESFSDIPDWVFSKNYLLSVCDGIERWESFDRLVASQQQGLLIVDNLEYASDWGRLPVGSGYPERVAAWREHIRNGNHVWLLFEEPEGRLGRTVEDQIGVEREGRKVTGITWKKSSAIALLGLTVRGTCLVSPPSIEGKDLDDLRLRCPYPTTNLFFNGLELGRSFE